MRADRTAVVDSMGTEALADRTASPETQRFQTLVALMLSSQTKDEVTGAAVIRLQKHGLDAATLAEMSEKDISDIIYPVGFYRNKGKYLSKTAKICVEQYGGDIPRDVKGLCALPGVGPKMAFICVNAAWSDCTGIGVDVHVHRISNRLKWVKGTKTPEETRAALEGWLPKPLWEEVNLLLVGFGQQTCQPRAPKCDQCMCNDTCSTGKMAMRSVLAAERKAAKAL
jgi:endonuclease-3